MLYSSLHRKKGKCSACFNKVAWSKVWHMKILGGGKREREWLSTHSELILSKTCFTVKKFYVEVFMVKISLSFFLLSRFLPRHIQTHVCLI